MIGFMTTSPLTTFALRFPIEAGLFLPIGFIGEDNGREGGLQRAAGSIGIDLIGTAWWCD